MKLQFDRSAHAIPPDAAETQNGRIADASPLELLALETCLCLLSLLQLLIVSFTFEEYRKKFDSIGPCLS